MAHIDTLETYRVYIAAGYTESQAVAAVKTLNSSFDGVATKEDLKNAITFLESKIGLMQKWEVGLLIAILVVVSKAAFW